jgi:hypothetical protein
MHTPTYAYWAIVKCIVCYFKSMASFDLHIFHNSSFYESSLITMFVSYSKFFYICLSLKKLINEIYFLFKEKFGLVSRKIISFYFRQKILSRNCKKIKKKSCYLLIISNLVLKLLIAEYFILIFFSILSCKI